MARSNRRRIPKDAEPQDGQPDQQPRVSPRGNVVGPRRVRKTTCDQKSSETTDSGPSGPPLAELQGRTDDGTWHRWRLFSTHLEVDGRWWRLSPTTTVGLDCREPVVIDQTTWEESPDERFNWAMALGVLQETGSWNDAGLAGWALADTVVEQVHRPDPHPGYVALFVHGLGSGTGEGTSVNFVQHSIDCQWREARRFAQILEELIARLP